MVSKPLATLFVACLSSAYAFAQAGNAMLDGARSIPPVAAQPADRPILTPEMRGDIYLARKMYREAIEAFHEGPQNDPVLWNKTGIAYHQLLQLDLAKKNYEQALRLKPDYVEAMNNVGTIYYAKRSYRRAINWYDKALKKAAEEKQASIYMNLGTAYFARKKYEDATKSFQVALRLDPEIFERHGNFGVMLEERNIFERAKYHFYLAKLYAKTGRDELALQYLRKALEEGLREKDKLVQVPEFATIRNSLEFKELLKLEPRVL
jgi:tetratricopeptide (TPR) repeat protein